MYRKAAGAMQQGRHSFNVDWGKTEKIEDMEVCIKSMGSDLALSTSKLGEIGITSVICPNLGFQEILV